MLLWVPEKQMLGVIRHVRGYQDNSCEGDQRGAQGGGRPSDCEAGLMPVSREGEEQLSRKAPHHHAGGRRL